MNTNELKLDSIASEKTDNFVVFPYSQNDIASHSHSFFELAYITSGSATQLLNGNTYLIEKGDYFIIDIGSSHSYINCNNLNLINCLFLPEAIDPSLQNCDSFGLLMQRCLSRYNKLFTPHLLKDHIFNDSDGIIEPLLLGMQTEYADKAPGYSEILRNRLMEILIHMMREILLPHAEHAENDLVNDVISYLEKNYDASNVIKGCCSKMHFSQPYICRKFKEAAGITMSDFLQRIRIRHSCELLLATDWQISRIAESVGYNDIKFFNQLFRRTLLLSPREYRKLYANTYS